MAEIGPVFRGHLQLQHLTEQRAEVVQAGDEGRTGMVEPCDVLADAAEQISALDPLQRHVTLRWTATLLDPAWTTIYYAGN